MPDNDTAPTETSPLLGKSGKASVEPPQSVHDALANGTTANGAPNGQPIASYDAERQEEEATPEADAKGMQDIRKRLNIAMPALAIGIFLAAMDQTLIVSAYGKIGSDLKALNNMSWIATAYFLTLTSFQPLYGKLSDIFGRKSALLFAYAVFGIGCLFCGLARTIDELIAARAFAGIGGGGMTTVVSILLSDIIPLRERGKWQGYVNIIYASGAGFGAPLGGIIADYISWRWAFLIQTPLTLIAFTSVFFVLKLPKTDDARWKIKLRRVDFLGAIILVAAVFTLLLGLDRGSNISWRAPIAIACLCISFPLFAIFVLVEMKVASEPFAPGHIIFERTLFSCYLCNFFSFGGWLAALFYIPLFYQAVDGLSASAAGVRLLPGIVAGVSGSLFAGFMMQKTGTYYWLTVAAYASLTIGMLPILLWTGVVSRSTWGISVGLAIGGFSNGIGVTTSLIALIANASAEDQAIATACSYLFRSLGSVVGISLSSTVVQQSLRAQLRNSLKSGKDADEIVNRVRQSLEYIKTLEPGVKEIVRECYERATTAAFGMTICIVAGALLSSFFIREKELRR
ncbi:MAG: hypothetical protein M1835_002541 [Candelina submexicana]|nr:MAG: hypothetical protein M1835_002541 [Candelina submexicana]